MKNLSVIVLLFVFSLTTFAQNEGKAQVKRRQGIEVYIFSEPLRPYEITGQVTNEDAASVLNAIADENQCRDIVEQIDVLINNALRKQKKGKFEFDAIITEDGSKGICIKFKEETE